MELDDMSSLNLVARYLSHRAQEKEDKRGQSDVRGGWSVRGSAEDEGLIQSRRDAYFLMVGRETPFLESSLVSMMHCWRGDSRAREDGGARHEADAGRGRQRFRRRRAVQVEHTSDERDQSSSGWMGELAIRFSPRSNCASRWRWLDEVGDEVPCSRVTRGGGFSPPPRSPPSVACL